MAVFIPAFLTEITGLVSVGASVARAAGQSGDYMITVRMEVDNLTDIVLMEPVMSMQRGECDVPPVLIASGHKEAMLARKRSYSTYGSYGVVVLENRGTKQRVAIMWSVPFEYVFASNRMAVGIADTEIHDSKWATAMLDADNNHGAWFERSKYATEINTVKWFKERFSVYATMSTDEKALLRVTFAPTAEKDIAKCLKDKEDEQKK